MLAKHFSHLVLEPRQSLEAADRQPASLGDIIIHTAMLALIPSVCGYIATVHIGWDLGAGSAFTLAPAEALMVAGMAFIMFNAGVYVMGYGIYWLAQTFELQPNLRHCTELALFSAVPLFLLGLVALYPVVIVNILVGLVALAASLYLLYTGLPIFMHIPREEGFMYGGWVVAIGLVMLIAILGCSVFFMALIR